MDLIIDKILLISSTISLFLVSLFLRKKTLAVYDYILSFWLIIFGLYVFIFAFSPSGYFLKHPWLVDLYISLLFLIGPFLYTYVKALTDPSNSINIRYLWHICPFLTILTFFRFFCTQCNVTKDPESFVEAPPPYRYMFILLTFSMLVYILFSIRILYRHKKVIADNFSDINKRTLSWLRILIMILGITWITFASIIYIHHVLLLFSDSFCIYGLFVTLSVFSVLVGYYGLYQPQIFIPAVSIEDENKPYSGSSLKDNEKLDYILLLKTYMNESKPFLNNQLTLSQLSSEVNIPLHQLSQLINEHYNRNFFDYINQFRVDEFIKRLSEEKYSHYSFLALAFDCGFNSKTAFNRFFKKSTGLTPSQYKDKYLASK